MKNTFILLLVLILTGCGTSTINNKRTVSLESKAGSNASAGLESKAGNETVTNEQGIDYDLSVMGADMVYATVYQMMVDPDSYVGKSFRVRGIYYSVYSEENHMYYHFCMIKDAAACCAQGIELLWKDEKMNMHEDCPDEDTVITVEGVFETYKEGKNTYGRIRDAKIV